MRRLSVAVISVFWLLVLVTGLAFAEGPVVGSNGALTWNQNPETDLAGYRVHLGQVSGTYSVVVDVGLTPTPTSPLSMISVFNLTEGQWYATVSAYDLAGNASGLSNVAPFVLDLAAPSDPGNVRVIRIPQ